MKTLKTRAELHGRPLGQELREFLTEAARLTPEEPRPGRSSRPEREHQGEGRGDRSHLHKALSRSLAGR